MTTLIDFKPRKADLLVYGPCSNAGDVLIHQTVVKLFESTVNMSYHHIRNSKLDGDSPNVIVGPGGLLSGSYKPNVTPDQLVIRFLTNAKVSQWKKEGRRVFCFASGTNTPFDAKPSDKPFSRVSESVIGNFAQVAQRIYLRGMTDIQRLQAFCRSEDLHKFAFQPCPSLFLDKIFHLPLRKEDAIAVNFPLAQVKDLSKHPIKKFVDFARSEGLRVDFLDNHPQDFNPQAYDCFDRLTHSQALREVCSPPPTHTPVALTELQELYKKEWMNQPCLADRFNGYRFAFGARLHSFLPFMAFETPTVFYSNNPIRTPMPMEYFGTPVFSRKHPPVYKGGEVSDNFSDGMIERLKFLIKNEHWCVDKIKENKERLWAITRTNMHEMLSLMA